MEVARKENAIVVAKLKARNDSIFESDEEWGEEDDMIDDVSTVQERAKRKAMERIEKKRQKKKEIEDLKEQLSTASQTIKELGKAQGDLRELINVLSVSPLDPYTVIQSFLHTHPPSNLNAKASEYANTPLQPTLATTYASSLPTVLSESSSAMPATPPSPAVSTPPPTTTHSHVTYNNAMKNVNDKDTEEDVLPVVALSEVARYAQLSRNFGTGRGKAGMTVRVPSPSRPVAPSPVSSSLSKSAAVRLQSATPSSPSPSPSSSSLTRYDSTTASHSNRVIQTVTEKVITGQSSSYLLKVRTKSLLIAPHPLHFFSSSFNHSLSFTPPVF